MSSFIEALYGHFFVRREGSDYKKKLTIKANFLGRSKQILESLAKMPNHFSNLTFDFVQKEEEAEVLQIFIEHSGNDNRKLETNTLVMSNRYKNVENARYIAFQRHLIDKKVMDVIQENGGVSLGDIRAKIEDVEPWLRDGGELLFYPDCIRASDLGYAVSAIPSGLFAEEACQLFKYLGGANHLTKLTLPLGSFADSADQWLPLYCELLWYFLEGLEISVNDHPYQSANQTFFVTTPSYDLEFVQSKLSGRWWVKKGDIYHPCSTSEYTDAANGNLSKRLYQLFEYSF